MTTGLCSWPEHDPEGTHHDKHNDEHAKGPSSAEWFYRFRIWTHGFITQSRRHNTNNALALARAERELGLRHRCPTHSGMTPALNPGHLETTVGSTFKCSDTISAGECLSHSDKENSSNRGVRKTAKNCMSVSPMFST